jgi:hypothetical protein
MQNEIVKIIFFSRFMESIFFEEKDERVRFLEEGEEEIKKLLEVSPPYLQGETIHIPQEEVRDNVDVSQARTSSLITNKSSC